jgi:peptide/nickel transport system permease protein
MTAYVIRRLLLSLCTILVVSLIIFLLLNVLSGDVASATLGETASSEDLAELREEYGLNDPLWIQYGQWLRDLLFFDLGNSPLTGRGVAADIADALPVTLELLVLSIIVGLVTGIPLGVCSAVTKGSLVDFVARFIAIMGLSVPVFVLALLAILLPVIWWGWTPVRTYVPVWESPWKSILQFSIPAVLLGIRLAGVNARMTRSALLEVLGSDYVRTARAKGLSSRIVVIRHGLRNALIPVTTVAGLQIVGLFSGVVIIEQIFALPGMGRLMLNALANRDFIIIQGAVMTIAVFAVLVNLAVDLTYVLLDPRIRGSYS